MLEGIVLVFVHNAWVVGESTGANRRSPQQIVDKAIAWERRSGATFESAKTAMIHFTKLADKDSEEPNQVKDRSHSLGRILVRCKVQHFAYRISWG